MRMTITAVLALLTACGAVLAAGEMPLKVKGGRDVSLKKEAENAIERGLRWLQKNQAEDGSWMRYPAVTALAATAMMGSRRPEFGKDSPGTARALACVQRYIKPDGGIYDRDNASYNTSICILALMAANDPAYHDVIRRARQYLIRLQCDEGEGHSPDSPYYGGIGYGSTERPDLSNLQWALEALRFSESLEVEPSEKAAGPDGTPVELVPTVPKPPSGLHWAKAIKFLERCQNWKETNDQPWAGTDGGFIYLPGESKAEGTRSYASMTYAGLKSFIYAKVDKSDRRVQAAVNWIRQNYTLDENPPIGPQGLYYNYHTLAKALNAYGEEILTDAKGRGHDWRSELIAKLLSLQHGDGYWVNENGRWWENQRELVTAYTVLALEIALSGY